MDTKRFQQTTFLPAPTERNDAPVSIVSTRFRIESFSGQYRFLSNFYPAQVTYEGITYPSTENAFQAAKMPDLSLRKQFVAVDPKTAKAMGRAWKCRSDWDSARNGVMLDLLRIKFSGSPFRGRLIATEGAELIEGNWWHDQYWGVCNCAINGTCARKGGVGENHLGKLLMQVRAELRSKS